MACALMGIVGFQFCRVERDSTDNMRTFILHYASEKPIVASLRQDFNRSVHVELDKRSSFLKFKLGSCGGLYS